MSSDLILMLENVSKEYPCSSTRREMFCDLLFRVFTGICG